MNNIEKKILLLKKKFKSNKYILDDKDIEDLEYRLLTKPVQLYLLAIEFLKKRKLEKISYEDVKELIILDIRIRDNIRKLITPLEEAIWVKYIDSKIKFDNLTKFNRINKTLFKVIEKLDDNDLHIIRRIRNDVSHLVYPILFDKISKIISDIKKLKEKDFVKDKRIDNLLKIISKANKNLKSKVINDLFKEIVQGILQIYSKNCNV